MCGIFCITGHDKSKDDVLKGLQLLEYRGYDSAGIAIQNEGEIKTIKSLGQVKNLKAESLKEGSDGNTIIGHTRWATHGEVSLVNTHPINNGRMAVVHNGILENYQELKKELEDKGYEFKTATDTEVLLQQLQAFVDDGSTVEKALEKLLELAKGSFAIVVISSSDDGVLSCAKRGSPMAIAQATDQTYVSSDVTSLSYFHDEYIVLENSDIAVVNKEASLRISNDGQMVERKIYKTNRQELNDDMKGFSSYIQKEIAEQPKVLLDIEESVLKNEWNAAIKGIDLNNITKIFLVACGSSYNAALVAKYWFESIARIAVEVDFASEFRARDVVYDKNALYAFISQSGETLDTLIALKKVKEQNLLTLSLLNAQNSSMSRLSDYVLPIAAGTEKSVAATKSFTAQLLHLLNLSLFAAFSKKIFSETSYGILLKDLLQDIKKLTSKTNKRNEQFCNAQHLKVL